MDINFNDFDKIMIGLGDEFGIKYPDSCKDSWDEYIYTKEHDNDDILSAYNNLADRLLGKDYFVVTTCTDDIIYQF